MTVPNIDLIPDPEKISEAIVQPIIAEEVVASPVCNIVVYQVVGFNFDDDELDILSDYFPDDGNQDGANTQDDDNIQVDWMDMDIDIDAIVPAGRVTCAEAAYATDVMIVDDTPTDTRADLPPRRELTWQDYEDLRRLYVQNFDEKQRTALGFLGNETNILGYFLVINEHMLCILVNTFVIVFVSIKIITIVFTIWDFDFFGFRETTPYRCDETFTKLIFAISNLNFLTAIYQIYHSF